VVKVLESSPVVVCQVKMLEDSDDRSQAVMHLADSTVQMFKDLVSLNVRVNSLPVRCFPESQSSSTHLDDDLESEFAGFEWAPPQICDTGKGGWGEGEALRSSSSG
jgi:hypothetical protein